MKEIPITEAKNALTRLIHQAEAGKPVRLTRRGKPVAVLLSNADFCRLEQVVQGKDLWKFVEQWRAGLPTDWEGITVEEVASWRDKSTGRDFSW